MYGAGVLDLILISLHKYLLLPLALRLANAVFSVSKTLKTRLTLRYPWIKNKVYVTLNGVDLDKFKPLNLEKIYDAVFLGRIHIQHKGIDKLLLTWKQITRKYPKATLILVGGFESERDRRILETLIKKLNVEDNIIVTGFVDDYEIISFLNRTRFFISLSMYEGFCLSLLEALACNTPAIVSDLEVFRELHGNTVFYVTTKDIRELAMVIERIAFSSYNVLVNESLTRALQSHVKKFSWDLVATKEFALIRAIVNLYHP
jgi:glycosyltransferase involved in cell wall biosynthesis